LTSGLIQAVCKKNSWFARGFAGISLLLYRLWTWSKHQKTRQVL